MSAKTLTAKPLDTENREQVRKLIERADANFHLSAKAYEIGNNSGDSRVLAEQTKRERRYARRGADLLVPLGIKCTWPGLYPAFEVKGFTEYTTENAVLSALGKPRNWLRQTSEETNENATLRNKGFYRNRTA